MHLYITGSQKKLLILAIVCVITACSGGTTPSQVDGDIALQQPDNVAVDQHNPDQNSIVQVADAMSGTIFIEERNGKTVFDATFSHISVPVITASSIDEVIGSDSCSASAVQSSASSNQVIELGAANGEADYANVGDAVTIESRVGQFEALIKQQHGILTVYAPNNRWQSVPLPDDAVLSFETGSVFEQLDLVEVQPLLPLVWLAPEAGVMSNSATSLKWEASLDEKVRIKVRFSSIDFKDSQNPIIVTVSCNLVDDGLFVLPAEFQQKLPDGDMGIVVYAVRERVQNIQANDSSLTVVQLSYPAPFKP